MGVCDDSEGDETDAEWDVDTAIHIGRVLDGGAFLHGLYLLARGRVKRERRDIEFHVERSRG